MQIPDDSLKYPSPAFVATFVEVKGLTFDVDGASCHFVSSLNYQVGLIVSPVLDTVMFFGNSKSLSFSILSPSWRTAGKLIRSPDISLQQSSGRSENACCEFSSPVTGRLDLSLDLVFP